MLGSGFMCKRAGYLYGKWVEDAEGQLGVQVRVRVRVGVRVWVGVRVRMRVRVRVRTPRASWVHAT